jgi:hypothetical protein
VEKTRQGSMLLLVDAACSVRRCWQLHVS